jgi:hypothetical protein
MTRMSKQAQRRSVSPKAPKRAGKKTGSKKDQLPQGFKEKHNALSGPLASYGFIAKY